MFRAIGGGLLYAHWQTDFCIFPFSPSTKEGGLLIGPCFLGGGPGGDYFSGMDKGTDL